MRPHRSPFESVRPQVNSGRDQSIRTLSFLGVSVRPFLQNPATSGSMMLDAPSKPCHIWVHRYPSSFKTLSHLGRRIIRNLQNPVTSGKLLPGQPSKPCHIWDYADRLTFKTLSHLGRPLRAHPSKPCHIWGYGGYLPFKTLSHLGIFSAANLQNPVTSGQTPARLPSKPCHIWEEKR